jgi:zinc transport system ATP-binding protein
MSAAISVDNVSVRFGEVAALRDVIFEVPEGASVALIGPNGAGKSTLLNVLLGTQCPDTGTVRLFGKPSNELPASDLGYVPQRKTLDRTFPAKALELVATGSRPAWAWWLDSETKSAALDVMKQTGVDHLADRPVSALSGGELQRVYLARVLLRRPRLLLLDEPGAGMDMAAEADVHHLLNDVQAEIGATVLMITHDWEGARLHASHAILLDRTVVAFGEPEAVITEQRLLRVFRHTGHAESSHTGHGDA